MSYFLTSSQTTGRWADRGGKSKITIFEYNLLTSVSLCWVETKSYIIYHSLRFIWKSK